MIHPFYYGVSFLLGSFLLGCIISIMVHLFSEGIYLGTAQVPASSHVQQISRSLLTTCFLASNDVALKTVMITVEHAVRKVWCCKHTHWERTFTCVSVHLVWLTSCSVCCRLCRDLSIGQPTGAAQPVRPVRPWPDHFSEIVLSPVDYWRIHPV